MGNAVPEGQGHTVHAGGRGGVLPVLQPHPSNYHRFSPSPATQRGLVVWSQENLTKVAELALPLANWVTLNHTALVFSSAQLG